MNCLEQGPHEVAVPRQNSVPHLLHMRGYSYLGLFNTQTRPLTSGPTSNAPGLAVGFNYSGAAGESDLWNMYATAATSFSFKQLTSTSTHTDLMTILANGHVGIGTANPGYQLQLGSDSAGKPNGGSWSNSSDQRLKKNIAPITDGLQRLMKLQPVKFDFHNWRLSTHKLRLVLVCGTIWSPPTTAVRLSLA